MTYGCSYIHLITCIVSMGSLEWYLKTQTPSRNISPEVPGLGYSQSTTVQNGSARLSFRMWRWTRKSREWRSSLAQMITSPSSNHRSLDLATFSSGAEEAVGMVLKDFGSFGKRDRCLSGTLEELVLFLWGGIMSGQRVQMGRLRWWWLRKKRDSAFFGKRVPDLWPVVS